MADMVCGRNVLWPNGSVDETSRKLTNKGSSRCKQSKNSQIGSWIM